MLREECRIQSDKQAFVTPDVERAAAVICLTSSQASAYDPVLFSLSAEFIQMLMVLASAAAAEFQCCHWFRQHQK